MKFIDEIEIQISSGKGGQGCTSFYRDKGIPRGGPDGGDGGKGGDVYFRVDSSLNTLFQYRRNKHYKAQNGLQGSSRNCTGADGEDLVLNVPLGTLIFDSQGQLLADLNETNKIEKILSGGRGGKGNHFFKTSVNQAPHHSQPGEPGESLEIRLELKLIADVGLVGYPNAGKSTLVSVLSAAKPKIADYPFTTLVPSLGVVLANEEQTFVVADIPGIIPGAHQGVGLGIQFLKHIERTKVFLHIIDISLFSGRDPLQDFKDIQYELREFDKTLRDSHFQPLMDRKQIVVLNKADTISEDEALDWQSRFQREESLETIIISAATRHNIDQLIQKTAKLVEEDQANE